MPTVSWCFDGEITEFEREAPEFCSHTLKRTLPLAPFPKNIVCLYVCPPLSFSRMSNTSDTCDNMGFKKPVSCGVFIGLGATLLLSCFILIEVTCTLCHRFKSLPRSKEKSYKTSKTSKRYKLSVRERYKRKEAWSEEDSVTSSEPMMTIGSAFGTPYHGPTPTSPPPPTDDFTNTGYCKEETNRPKDHGQIPNVAEPRLKKKVPLRPAQYKTLPSALGRKCFEDLDDALNKTGAVGPLCHTLDYRLDQSDRQEHPSLTDAWYNQPNEWDRHPDDCRPYYMGKLSHQNIRKEEGIHGNDVFDVNEILKNANAIEVIHEITLTENMYESLVPLREDKTTQNLNPAFRQSIQSYIDMTASPDGEEYVQMKITLTKSAASEICRKAGLRGMSCTSEVLHGYVLDKPTNSSVDRGVGGEDYVRINSRCPAYTEITD